VGGTDSELCPSAGFDVNGVKPSNYSFSELGSLA